MDSDKIRSVLNTLFLVLALVTIVVYFLVKDTENMKIFFYTCGAAICVKLMEFYIRFTNR